jgi:hypothetical protein
VAEGKGAITGLVIDDRYRPVAGAFILLTPGGLSATSDELGQFQVLDLEPGSYVALAQAKDHEAAPRNADVRSGEYTELELQARRIFSDAGSIITTEYSIFIDCAEEAVVIANSGETEGVSCMMDQSGDSARGGFDTTISPRDANLTTYMVTEVLFNQKGTYATVIGLVDDTDSFSTYYAEADTLDDVYQRIQMRKGTVDNRTGEDTGGRNVKWNADKTFTTFIFPHGMFYREMQENFGLWGLGVSVGVKAKIIQSVFLGEPRDDIEAYALLKPAG